MTLSARFRMSAPWGPLPALLAALAFLAPAPAGAQASNGCVRCHGELELLRQHVPTLERARELLTPPARLAASAHGDMTCVECHSGFGRFPHLDDGTTETCASCHAEAERLWQPGIHAEDDNASCSACHGIHEVADLAAMEAAQGARAVRATCATCHFEPRIPADDPHADSISCAGCHEPHGTLPPEDRASAVHASNQAATCGACHEEVSEAWITDIHGRAADSLGRPGTAAPEGATSSDPPGCSACHGAHGMLAPSHEGFDQEMVGQCSACHEDYAETYFGTYHGKATALGSVVVATCDHCHGSHSIFPRSDARSAVADERLVETCGRCHAQARPAFVAYDSHPDPMDRSRNAPLYYSFIFMNTLLVGVLGLFALHTLLWWLRLLIDQQKGVAHGIGEGHD